MKLLVVMFCTFAVLVRHAFDCHAKVQKNLDDNRGTSMFERLCHSGCVPMITLEEQHRMPLCIASFSSAQYYGGKLLTPNRTLRAAQRGYSWPQQIPSAS